MGKTLGTVVPGVFWRLRAFAIPLGIALHFIAFAPQLGKWAAYAGLSLAILLFTAWPEELLFRGLLQNFLSKASRAKWREWWTASVLFGF